MFFCVVFRIDFLMHFLPKICLNCPLNLVHLTSLFRPFSRLRFFVVFWSLLGSLLTAPWHPLCSFWYPSGSYWYPFGQTIFPRPGGGTIAAGNRDPLFGHQVAPKSKKMNPRMRHQKMYENLIEI